MTSKKKAPAAANVESANHFPQNSDDRRDALPQVETVALADISEDTDTQIRRGVSAETVQRYAAALSLPPVDLFRIPDGRLIPGFHRIDAACERGDKTIEARIRTGTIEDAKVFAIRANTRHGLPLSKTERDEAILFLADIGWSGRKIGDEMNVDEKTVRNVLAEREVRADWVRKFPQANDFYLKSTEARTIAKAPQALWADLAQTVCERRFTKHQMKAEDLEQASRGPVRPERLARTQGVSSGTTSATSAAATQDERHCQAEGTSSVGGPGIERLPYGDRPRVEAAHLYRERVERQRDQEGIEGHGPRARHDARRAQDGQGGQQDSRQGR